MQVEITGTCGHTKARNITNSAGQEPSERTIKKSVAYWSTKDCTDCYRNEKKVEAANTLEQFGNLPELVGSEKQVAWATRIRENQLVKISDHLFLTETVRDWVVANQPEDESKANATMARHNATAALIATLTEAKFWIDTRDEESGFFLTISLGHDHTIKIDLEAGKVLLGQRGKQKEISYIQKRGYYKGTPRTILVGGNKFYDREVA